MRTKAMLEDDLARYDDSIAKLLEQRQLIDLELTHYRIERKTILRLLGRPEDDSSSSSEEAASDHQAPRSQATTSAGSSHQLVVAHPQSHGLVGNLDTLPPYSVKNSTLIASRHNSKLRCLEFLMTNQNQFVTCADDGYVRKWELAFDSETRPMLEDKMSVDVTFRTLFPEDIAINPLDDSLVVVYGQREEFKIVSLVQEVQEEARRVTLVQNSPHPRGISRVAFMPLRDNNPVLVTAGKRHQVATWTCIEEEWVCGAPYKLHTNSITGICGLPGRSAILTSGRDKRVFCYDYRHAREDFKLTVDAPCLGIASNPADPNLICIQTGADGAQLRLWDLRKKDQVRSFGWKSSGEIKKEAAIVDPVWCPTGVLLSAGSAEKEVRIFDIRYSVAKNPTKVISAHEKRVFKVAWAPAHSLLVSISMDRYIGLHSIVSAGIEV